MAIRLNPFIKEGDWSALIRFLAGLARRSTDSTIDRVLKSKISNIANSTTLSNFTDEDFDITQTFSAGMFTPGKILHIISSGIYSTTGTPTLAINHLVNASGVGTVGALYPTGVTTANNADNQFWMGESWTVFRAIGTSGVAMSNGKFSITTQVSPRITTTDLYTRQDNPVDISILTTLVINPVFSVANASNTVTLQNLITEFMDY